MNHQTSTLPVRALLICALALALFAVGVPSAYAADFNVASAADIDTALASVDAVINMTVTSDINLGTYTGSRFTIVAGKTVSLDLNGFTIEGVRDANTSTAIFAILGSMEVHDSSTAQTGTLKIGSTVFGNTGSISRIFANGGGTLEIDSGNFINTGNAALCNIIDSVTGAGAPGDAINTISGGSFSSAREVVRIADFTNNPFKNILNVTDGYLDGQSSVIFVQTIGGNPTAPSGNMEVNISGGHLNDDNHALLDAGVVSVIIGYRANNLYTPIDINVSDGFLYSRPNPTTPQNRPTICLGVTFATGADGLAMMDQLDGIPVFVTITGGVFDNAPGVPNVDNAMWGDWADWFVFNPAHVFIYAGAFSYDPTPFVCDNAPIAHYTAADASHEWWLVNNEYISVILREASDGTLDFVSGTYTLAEGDSATIASGVNATIKPGATVFIEPGAAFFNDGSLTVQGTLDITGTLYNEGALINSGGTITGSAGAYIVNGASATTNTDPSKTVFFSADGKTPITGAGIAGKIFTFAAPNKWVEVPGKDNGGDTIPPTGDTTALVPLLLSAAAGGLFAVNSVGGKRQKRARS